MSSELLKEKIAKQKVDCWLVNTGWSGGGYGVGSRMKIAYSRAHINAAIDGVLNEVEFEKEPLFGLMILKSCPGVPDGVLNPRNVWADEKAYDATARNLLERFRANFEQHRGFVSKKVVGVL